jgi:putative flavoprotein involved in K+ transport
MPGTGRGKDIQFWLHKAGIFDERYAEVDDIDRARTLPSPQPSAPTIRRSSISTS